MTQHDAPLSPQTSFKLKLNKPARSRYWGELRYVTVRVTENGLELKPEESIAGPRTIPIQTRGDDKRGGGLFTLEGSLVHTLAGHLNNPFGNSFFLLRQNEADPDWLITLPYSGKSPEPPKTAPWLRVGLSTAAEIEATKADRAAATIVQQSIGNFLRAAMSARETLNAYNVTVRPGRPPREVTYARIIMKVFSLVASRILPFDDLWKANDILGKVLAVDTLDDATQDELQSVRDYITRMLGLDIVRQTDDMIHEAIDQLDLADPDAETERRLYGESDAKPALATPSRSVPERAPSAPAAASPAGSSSTKKAPSSAQAAKPVRGTTRVAAKTAAKESVKGTTGRAGAKATPAITPPSEPTAEGKAAPSRRKAANAAPAATPTPSKPVARRGAAKAAVEEVAEEVAPPPAPEPVAPSEPAAAPSKPAGRRKATTAAPAPVEPPPASEPEPAPEPERAPAAKPAPAAKTRRTGTLRLDTPPAAPQPSAAPSAPPEPDDDEPAPARYDGGPRRRSSRTKIAQPVGRYVPRHHRRTR